ncbi:hypothetical protein GE061_000061 [Apolygus lucorum]|uniref:CCHC-type domain-containing protein n=1 Tax=Apolygus lucorum TaxID=248454 RepID=A0A8S9Y4Q1_APOLU|nr:hypothetical protein GE061_000061 [Apolygus lucorum]
MSQFDGRIRRLAFTQEFDSRERLMKELSGFSHNKRPHEPDNYGSSKKGKFNVPTTATSRCSYCNKGFHALINCYAKQKADSEKLSASPNTSPAARSSTKSPRNTGSCYICQSTAHWANRCPNRSTGRRELPKESTSLMKVQEKRVNTCVAYPPGHLMHKDPDAAGTSRVFRMAVSGNESTIAGLMAPASTLRPGNDVRGTFPKGA